jgi:predicted enzyme related to lactoylglutathione lyase
VAEPQTPPKHKRGSVCTAVLRTKHLERAANFYGALMGWKSQQVLGSTSHRLLQMDGKTVGSIHQISEGDDVWVPHVSVESVESALDDALMLGATLVDTADIPTMARLATLRDPEGAMFGLWQPAPNEGAQITDQAGSLWWIEVLSNDVAGARAFYGRMFGWTGVETSFEPFPVYTVFKRGDVQEGGILPIKEDWDVSPRWNSIFAVHDCDATIERATGLGGSPLFVHTVPKHGRIGSFSDPGGAAFVMRGPAAPGH